MNDDVKAIISDMAVVETVGAQVMRAIQTDEFYIFATGRTPRHVEEALRTFDCCDGSPVPKIISISWFIAWGLSRELMRFSHD